VLGRIDSLVLASKKAAGTEMDLVVAANMNLSTDGMTFLALHCKRNEVTLLENPMALRHLPEQGEARKEFRQPLGFGGDCHTIEDFALGIKKQAGTVLVPDAGRIGGVTMLARTADLAKEARLQMAPVVQGGPLSLQAVARSLSGRDEVLWVTSPYQAQWLKDGQSQVVGPRLGQWLKGLDQPVHKKPKGWHRTWDFGPRDYDETKFTDHVTATWVAEQLGNKHDKPFFLSVGFYRPHVPFFPPRRIYDSFQDVQLPRVDDDDWSDLPDAARKVTLSNPRIPTHDWMRENGRWQQAVHAYLACVRWTDEQLGRVLDALDNGPHAKNTIVVLFSDHGYHLGEKQRWSKFSLWKRTTHVPLIISVPHGVKGRTDKPVELLSIYPTLIDLCGLPASSKLEGVSLRPLLENPNADWEHVAVSTLGQNNHAVRDQRWRYIRYADGSEELYDHQSDSNEWNNLAVESPTPSYSEVIARLKRHLPKTNVSQRGNEPKKSSTP
jgi:hypothetical protein